jgi:flagellar secretion chaperone FliS
MYRNASNAYQHAASNTVEDKKQILLKVFDGAIRLLNQAAKSIENNQAKSRGESISSVMAIITELEASLDMDKGGQLAQNLSSLYRYVLEKLTQANCFNDLTALNDTKGILTTLKEGFEDAVQQLRVKATSPVTEPMGYAQHTYQQSLSCAI